MKKALAVLLAAVMCCTLLSACGQPETTDPTEGTEGTQTETNAADLVYAVEAGSAGEAIAKEKGWQTNPVTAQADTLMEVSAGTSDAAIIDLLMAAAMTGEGTSYPDLTYDSQGLTTEEYGIGCRKGTTAKDIAYWVNAVLQRANLSPDAIADVSSIDVKQDETGLLAFAKAQQWPLHFFTADELNAVPGDFTASDFVKQTVGTDNVCERAAVLASHQGTLIVTKQSRRGITVAVACERYQVRFAC